MLFLVFVLVRLEVSGLVGILFGALGFEVTGLEILGFRLAYAGWKGLTV